ncbi:MAG TPA: FG-GAP-like repeat-containing protein [Polyangiaceae bacterium LLY-WYZ-15_(1-7)]|nr:hypothetical protein [Sandaracinus sp.]HJL01185.1 FG-GAP-like repeat-containing protein [Polyangiaceae bacterium LLY-WYZ-15_(1-7)]MBJ71096.1 hypothetical protein [Sandaracinus sp.]HJL10036.1 FG-GAP-like repeat-containing protein [Polyangiaceae bacterium LLY-WYZ-15_(1-7)]HJL36691.1 FG-GAP-like repeat-containing protein [Polyangiaceae bacterium LLY-WYZ-15_(1-7)]
MLASLRPRWAPALLSLLLTACDCGGGGGEPGECTTRDDCGRDEICVDGRCVDAPDTDAGGADATVPGDGGTCELPCGGACCEAGELCVDDACVADLGPCETSDDCADDSFCADGRCVPYGPPGRDRDDECSRVIVAGTFQPTVQCAFDEAPEGDAFPAHLHVLSTPMVVDFRQGRGPDDPAAPSIVAVFDDGVDGSSEQPTGVIRILDGRTCVQQAELGSLQLVSHSSPPAVGDLDGDGVAEIVAFKAGGGLVAFTWDADAGAWTLLWRSTTDGTTPFDPTGSGWAGPSIADLDDDGVPEVMRSGYVFDADGVLLDDTLGNLPGSNVGVFAVTADVDGDGVVEHVQGHGVWQWDAAGTAWVAESWSPGGTEPGHVAIADFGAFPGSVDWPASAPEVAVVGSGFIRVQTLDGTPILGPLAIPEGGQGGPPTIADFDGDGRPEVSTAGASRYVVVDLDCAADPIGECASGRTDGILWTQPSQDQSSNRTGSSVFDFEGDGRAEVVYGDECFLRVYDGETGDVVFSQARSSCTWYENPVIADLDGDFNAEIVLGDNFNCPNDPSGTGRDCTPFGLDARQTDPLFAGLRCSEDADCLSASCVEGLCRCTTDEECCAGLGCDSAPFVCEAPPAGTPGSGNTCRASRPRGTRGVRVFSDAADRWVRSRTIWNQHAYHVTNVNDDGTIPRSSDAELNWTADDLNNFRANVQGAAIPGAAPDLTARGTPVVCDAEGIADLAARVCNRGTEPIGAGMSVGFYEGTEPSDETLICRGATATVLEPGECEAVSCPWGDPPAERPGVDVTVVADDLGENGECFEGNNLGTLPGVFCGTIE